MAVLLVGEQQQFGVRQFIQPVVCDGELCRQFFAVIQSYVRHQHEPTIVADKWLLLVNRFRCDMECQVRKTRIIADVIAAAIRSPMRGRCHHRFQISPLNRFAVKMDNATNGAH